MSDISDYDGQNPLAWIGTLGHPGQGTPSGRPPGTRGTVQPPPTSIPPVVPASRDTHNTVIKPREITINQSAEGMVRAVAFGPCTIGARWVYFQSFGAGINVYMVSAHGEGPLLGITPKIDGVVMNHVSGNWWNARGGLINAYTYDGSQTNFQETASGLIGFDPTWITNAAAPLNAYDNLAYTVIKWVYEETFNPDLPDFTFDLQGYSDLYDARTTLRGYSENFSLMIRELLSNQRWGARMPSNSTYFDDTEFATAADDCDVAVFPIVPTVAPTCVVGSSGVLLGNFRYVVTNVTAAGVETSQSPASFSIFPSSQQVVVTVPAGDGLTASRNVYRSGNGDFSRYHRIGSLGGSIVGTVTDSMSTATWLAQPTPAIFTAGQHRYSGGLLCEQQAQLLEWLHTLRAHCLGVITTEAGRYQLRINKVFSGGYTPQTYSEFHNWGGNNENPNVVADSIQWGRARRLDLFNEVEVKYTDRQNGFTAASVIKQRASVIAGTEMPRRATYELPGLLESGIAARIAIQLLNLSADDASFTWTADRTALRSQIWDIVYLSGAGLNLQPVRVRGIKSDGENFVLTGSEYRDSSFVDTIVQADAPIVAGTSVPATPMAFTADLTAPTGLTLTEQDDETSPHVYNPKIVVNWTPYAGNFYGGTQISYKVGSGPVVTLGTFQSGPVYIPMPEGWNQSVVVSAASVNQNTLHAGTAATASITISNPSAPEPIADIFTNSNGDYYWNRPVVRTHYTFGASAWSSTGGAMTSFTASKMNDAILNVVACQFSATGKLVLDTGASIAYREIDLTWMDDPGAFGLLIEYSTNGTVWNSIGTTQNSVLTSPNVGGLRQVILLDAAIGAFRYLRFNGNASITAFRIAEIQVASFTATPYPATRGYRLTGYVNGGGGTLWTKDINFTPDATHAIPSTEWTYIVNGTVTYVGDVSSRNTFTRLDVQTLSVTNVPSDPRRVTTGSSFAGISNPDVQTFVPQGVNSSIAIVAGTQTIAIDNISDVYRLTGVAGTLSGMSGGSPGRIITIVNATSGAVTISHNDAAATNVNRFALAQVPVVLAATEALTVVYDAGAGVAAGSERWRMIMQPPQNIAFTTQPVGDNSTKIATTAFVQANNMRAIKQLFPNAAGGGNQGPVTSANPASSTTFQTVLNITNASGGFLRFCSAGWTVAGNVTLQITIDGTVVFSGTGLGSAGTTGYDAVGVGSMASGLPQFEMMPFLSSLKIEVKEASATGTATCKYSYATFV